MRSFVFTVVVKACDRMIEVLTTESGVATPEEAFCTLCRDAVQLELASVCDDDELLWIEQETHEVLDPEVKEITI